MGCVQVKVLMSHLIGETRLGRGQHSTSLAQINVGTISIFHLSVRVWAWRKRGWCVRLCVSKGVWSVVHSREECGGQRTQQTPHFRHVLLLCSTAYTRPSGLWAPGPLRRHHRSDYRRVTASGFVWVWRSEPWRSCLQVKDFSLWAVSSVCGCCLKWSHRD